MITITILDDAWEDVSDGDGHRLLATVSIANTLHHIDAVEVEIRQIGEPPRAEQWPVDSSYDDWFGNLCVSFDTGQFNTVEIDGRQYCLFMAPSGD